MKEKSTPQKKPSKEQKKKQIGKQNTPKTKFLKYKPSKGDQSKQWVIQAILNQRITLLPLTEATSGKNNHPSPKQKQKQKLQTNIFQNYQKVKEYEIAWAQNRKQGLWPNTWEPQQNIPQDTRLDYLLKKRNKLNEKKNKRTSNFKNKQSLQKHIEFTMNKLQIGRRAATLGQRRNQSQKTIKKVLNEKSPRKNTKSHEYKNWFFSFSSKTDEYDKMIHRFLKQQKNPIQKSKQLPNTKPQKLQNLKAEFIESVQTLKEETNDDGVSQLLQKSEKSPNKAQNGREEENKAEYVPKKTCLKLVKDIAYLGEVDNVHRFILKYHDGSLKFIREDDLIKYLPWIYEKLMIRTVENQLQDCAEKFASMNPEGYHHAGRHLEELSYEVGLPRNYFWQLQKEQSRRKNRFFTSPANQSNNNFNEFSFFYDHQLSAGKQKPQVNPSQDKDFNQITNEIEQLHIEKINQIQKCFNSLSQSFPQDDTFLNQSSFIFGQVKKKISQDYKLTNCKYLFPSNSKLIDEWKSTKSSLQAQKLPNVKKQIRHSSIKIEHSFESKQSKSNKHEKSDKKPKSTLKIQSHDNLPNVKNKGEPSKKETTEIKENSNNHEKKPYKKVKLTEEDQINQILGQMEETPTNKKKDDFYDSEDEQSRN